MYIYKVMIIALVVILWLDLGCKEESDVETVPSATTLSALDSLFPIGYPIDTTGGVVIVSSSGIFTSPSQFDHRITVIVDGIRVEIIHSLQSDTIKALQCWDPDLRGPKGAAIGMPLEQVAAHFDGEIDYWYYKYDSTYFVDIGGGWFAANKGLGGDKPHDRPLLEQGVVNVFIRR